MHKEERKTIVVAGKIFEVTILDNVVLRDEDSNGTHWNITPNPLNMENIDLLAEPPAWITENSDKVAIVCHERDSRISHLMIEDIPLSERLVLCSVCGMAVEKGHHTIVGLPQVYDHRQAVKKEMTTGPDRLNNP